MGANAFYPQPILSFNELLKPGRSSLSPREVADWPSSFGIQRNPFKCTYLSIRADGSRGDRPSLKIYAARRTGKGDGNELLQTSNGSGSGSSNKEEIIAVFNRIKSSISNREAGLTKKRNSSSTDKPKVESIFQPGKEVKVTGTLQIKGVPEEEQKVHNDEPVASFKLTRLPSSFVRRSPIPSPSASVDKFLEANNEPSANKESNKQLQLPRVEELKLPQLKELAKARGIKGYSRMKKSELVKRLRS